MKSIFEQYGTVIIVSIVIVALIGISVAITPLVKDNYSTMVDSFFGQVEDVDTSGSGGSTGGAGGAGGSSETCPSGGTHNLQNGRQWSDEMIETIAPSLGHTPQEVKDLIPTGAFDNTYVCSQCYSIVDLINDKTGSCLNGGTHNVITLNQSTPNQIELVASNMGYSVNDINSVIEAGYGEAIAFCSNCYAAVADYSQDEHYDNACNVPCDKCGSLLTREDGECYACTIKDSQERPETCEHNYPVFYAMCKGKLYTGCMGCNKMLSVE